jgi:hypothetical protein
VLNILTGDGATGAALVDHPDVDKLAFTGSTDVGRIIRKATAGSGKKLSLELGGKSPFIVFEDADLDSVVEGVVDAIWFNQGQVCCAGSRLLMQEGIADALIAKLRARMEKLRVGSPLDKAVDMGAIVAPVQLERIRSLVEQGAKEGAEMWQPSWAVPKDGCFYPPTLFTNVAPSSTIAQVEIFGPVLVSMSFRTPEEAVALANNTPFGLAASIWSENINLALDVAPKVKAGVVWINCTNMFDAAAGFGGYREDRRSKFTGEKCTAQAGQGRVLPTSIFDLPSHLVLIAHRNCSSRASNRGPTAATRFPSSRPAARPQAKSERATERTSETPSKPRAARRRHGRAVRDTTAGRFSITSAKIFPRDQPSSRRASANSAGAMANRKSRRRSHASSPTPRGPTSGMDRCTKHRFAASRSP